MKQTGDEEPRFFPADRIVGEMHATSHTRFALFTRSNSELRKLNTEI